MQISFILTEPATPENVGAVAQVLKTKVQAVLPAAGFSKNSNIYHRFMQQINLMNEDDMDLLHSFCNKFTDNKK